jgi:geranylgeranyl diphosphate synthase type II
MSDNSRRTIVVLGVLVVVLALMLAIVWGPQCIAAYHAWCKRERIAEWRTQQKTPPCDTPMPHVLALQLQTRALLRTSIKRDFGDTRQMQEICEYSLEGGKMVRAMLTQVVASVSSQRHTVVQQKQKEEEDAIQKATAEACMSIEYIHAASLMLDDEMDGDEERRGKPSAYIRYGSTASQLAALQLMTTAFVKTTRATAHLREAYGTDRGNELGMAMFDSVSRNLQLLGMGQYLDLYPTNAPWAKLGEAIGQQRVAHVEEVIRKKTVTLFEVSLVYGWLLRNGSFAKLDDVRALAYAFGMLFQIADDCEDHDMDLLRASKNIAMNYVIRHGADKTRKQARRLVSKCRDLCASLDIRTEEINELLTHLLSRVNFFCSTLS